MRVHKPRVLLPLLVVPRPLLHGPQVVAGPDPLWASLLPPLALLPFLSSQLVICCQVLAGCYFLEGDLYLLVLEEEKSLPLW